MDWRRRSQHDRRSAVIGCVVAVGAGEEMGGGKALACKVGKIQMKRAEQPAVGKRSQVVEWAREKRRPSMQS